MLNFEVSNPSLSSQIHHYVDASDEIYAPNAIVARNVAPVHVPGAASLQAGLLQAVLDQVDYGMAVVDTDTQQLIFANAHALCALAENLPRGVHDLNARGLRLTHGHLSVQDDDQADQLKAALTKTKSRMRGLLRLTDHAGQELTIAVMPLSGFDGIQTDTATLTPAPSYALLVFAKQQLCDTTSVTLFARERGLTSAEGQVLAHVCKGLRPAQIATHQGVQVSTVRTQLRAIRQKTASDSMRQLVQKVSSLPPLARYMPSFLSNPQQSLAA